MRVDSFDLSGLEAAHQGIRSLGPDVGYFLLYDTSVPKQEVRADRLDFEPQRVAPFMPLPPASAASARPDDEALELDEDDLEPDDDDLDEDDPDEDEASGQHTSAAPPFDARYFGQTAGLDFSHTNMLEAVCTWLTRAGVRLGQTAPAIKLRVQAIAAKGSKVLFTATFWVQNLAYRKDLEELARAAGLERLNSGQADAASASAAPSSTASGPATPVGHLPIPSPQAVVAPQSVFPPTAAPPPNMLIYPAGYQDGTLFGTAGAFRALNESYVQFGQAMTNGVSSLQDMMTRMLDARGVELVQSREQVNKLLTEVLNYRLREVDGNTDVAQLQVEGQRAALMREAVNQMGETARAMFMSRGMSPALADVLSTLSGNQELMDALQQPAVRELLKDPSAQRELTNMLIEAGRMSQGAPAPARQLPPGAPDAGSRPAQAALPPGASPHTLHNTSPSAPPMHVQPAMQRPNPYGVAGSYPPAAYPGPAPGYPPAPTPQMAMPGSPNPYQPMPSYQVPPAYPAQGSMPPGYPPYPPGPPSGWAQMSPSMGQPVAAPAAGPWPATMPGPTAGTPAYSAVPQPEAPPGSSPPGPVPQPPDTPDGSASPQ